MSAALIDKNAERKLPPLDLPKENVEQIVALLDSKKSSAVRPGGNQTSRRGFFARGAKRACS